MSASRDGGAGRTAPLIEVADKVITYAATAIAVFALVALFLALGAEVVVRYFTTQGLGWPSEMPSLLFPWLVMGGIVLADQRGAHISVTILLGMLGRDATRALLLAMQVLIAATFFYLAYIGLDVIEITGTEVYPVTGVSARWAYLVVRRRQLVPSPWSAASAGWRWRYPPKGYLPSASDH